MNSKQQQKQLPTLYCTVGLPFSGKEAWAACQGLPVVSLAANETVVGSKATQKTKATADPLAFTRQLIECLFAAGNQVVILLAENLSEKEQEYWQNPDAWQTVFREFQISEKEALRKAMAAGVSKQELDRIKQITKAKPMSTDGK
ncbi:hypothetical protein [Microscilla marina]|uniref:Uncharacterized protein n=1 Tax=Microscilla marina ATCC 23134 TaxID=313606 RepID=A1ZUB5_MICM2|nr:hypothetical protein [Microscilla marina]EAY26086.1 hypothetical protein M23134_06435 [Microscilla marina ATCC 23134]